MNVVGVGLFLVTLTGAWDLVVESGETRAKIVTGRTVLLTLVPKQFEPSNVVPN